MNVKYTIAHVFYIGALYIGRDIETSRYRVFRVYFFYHLFLSKKHTDPAKARPPSTNITGKYGIIVFARVELNDPCCEITVSTIITPITRVTTPIIPIIIPIL